MHRITCSATILDMRTTTALLAALALALPVAAQTAKPGPPPPAIPLNGHPATAAAAIQVNENSKTPPTITAEQRAAYWKAVFQQSNLQKQLDAAGQAVQTEVQAMVVTCGINATLQQALNGDPVCVAKPAEKK